jgi:hypothetical protein
MMCYFVLFQELKKALFYIVKHPLVPSLLSIPLALQMKSRRGSVDDEDSEDDMSTSSKPFQEILYRLMRHLYRRTAKSSLGTLVLQTPNMVILVAG